MADIAHGRLCVINSRSALAMSTGGSATATSRSTGTFATTLEELYGGPAHRMLSDLLFEELMAMSSVSSATSASKRDQG